MQLARFAAPALLCVFFAASIWLLHSIDRKTPLNETDLLPRWAGTRLALQGRDPYSPALIRQAQQPYSRRVTQFFYPATLVVLLAPLARFSPETAGLIFLSLVVPLLTLSLWMVIRILNLPREFRDRVFVLVATFSSWALLWGLRMEQPTLLVAALVFLSWFLLAKGRQVAPGILLALATIKPQLILPLLLWLFVWTLARRRWTFIGSFALTLVFLFLAAERFVPGWFPRWLASIQTFDATARPLEFVFGHLLGLTLTLVLAAATGIALWRLRRCTLDSPQFSLAIGLSLAVALCIFPTMPLMIYNNLLLFPAVLLLLFQKPPGPIGAVVRFLALVQLTLDFGLVLVAALGEVVFRAVSFYWPGLAFLDFLLPVLTTTFLILQATKRNLEAPLAAPVMAPS